MLAAMYEDEISRIAFAEPDMVRHLLALLPAEAVAGLAETVTQWRREALDEGRQQGMSEALSHERALLRRQAARRFGVRVGDELAALLANEEDVERLAAVGDLVIDCTSPEDLLRHGRGLLNGKH